MNGTAAKLPRFSLATRIREHKANARYSASDEEKSINEDPDLAQFFAEIRRRENTQRSSLLGPVFSEKDFDISSTSSESDDISDGKTEKEVVTFSNETQVIIENESKILYSAVPVEPFYEQWASDIENISLSRATDDVIEPLDQSADHIAVIGSMPLENSATPPTAPGPRKSRRTRIKPCAFWRMQRPKYKRDSTGLAWYIDGVEEGSKEETGTFTAKEQPKKRRALKKMNHDFSIHVSKAELALNESRIKQLLKSNLVKDKSSFQWLIGDGTGDEIKIAITHQDKSKAEAWGLLEFEGLAKKPSQETGDYTSFFTVMRGVVSVKIGRNPSVVLRNCQMFEIPAKTLYSVENVTRDEALLHFIVKK